MHTHQHAAGERFGTADPLWPEVIAWIDGLRHQGETILPYPISRLQRQFRIGYSRSCALVDALALDRHWTIEFTEDGKRCACPRAQA
ncbi:hypothetical protein QPK32_01455 [Massilia sp. YIM B02763]|uniref:hypothetical protein n=1 Tax=Massilia sp. YIM B02763 TaxID=3050130 RepID=UPI0025B7113E|nr:hypothetical protein [Massilia sp. YIM B02763]MDN4051750.1 hypothetical protein [Massilia sp. YIM B02763]